MCKCNKLYSIYQINYYQLNKVFVSSSLAIKVNSVRRLIIMILSFIFLLFYSFSRKFRTLLNTKRNKLSLPTPSLYCIAPPFLRIGKNYFLFGYCSSFGFYSSN